MHIKGGNRMLYLATLIRYSNWMSNSPNTSSIDRNASRVAYTLNIRDRRINLVDHDAVFGKERPAHDCAGERMS